jgi:hypothetical protein
VTEAVSVTAESATEAAEQEGDEDNASTNPSDMIASPFQYPIE